MNLIRNIMLMCLFVLSTIAIQFKANVVAWVYGVSCTNTSYGTQLGGRYLELNPLTTNTNDQFATYGMF